MPAIYNPEMSMAGFGDFGDVVAMLSRYFTTLDPAAGAYYEVQPIELAIGDHVELGFFASDMDWQTVISCLTDTDSRTVELRQNSDGTCEMIGATSTFNMYLDGSLIEQRTTPFPSDGKIHTLLVEFLNVTPYTLSSLGVRAANPQASTGSLSGGFSFAKIYKSGQLVRNYKFDDSDGILVDYANPLGDELVVNGEFESGYIDPSSTYTNLNTSIPSARTTKWLTLDVGTKQLRVKRVNSTRFVVQFSNDNVQTALASIVSGNTQDSVINVPEGATNVRVYYGHSSDVNPSISIKRADGYGQAINVTQADRELMTFDESRNAWIGQVSGNIIEVA